MVKNKRDLKSPRRNRSLTGSRPATRGRPTSSGAGGNIRVLVRVRPLNEREGGDCRNVIKIIDNQTMVFDPKEEDEPFFYHGVQQRNRDILKRANKNLHFTFDRVFGHDADNTVIFQDSTKGLIQTLMNGYNCSVFVYGATGAGKTHTMLGREEDPGITFLTMTELFRQKEELSHERDFELGITYLEVYNETVQDLLNPGPTLQLREDGRYGVIVAGIQVHRTEDSERLFQLLEQGNRNRTQHPTDANAESSRSHAVFQVYLHMKYKATGEIRAAKLSMIDLAGSERGAATGYSGARFTEGANINKSLLALGNCINSLADGQRHVPYRDSKLTRLLKDSLGGNCQTVMVANVSPSIISYEDTYNTLKYAMRAKKIKSNMKKNVVNCEMNINHYVKLADELSRENEQLKLQLSLMQKPCRCQETASTSEDMDQQLRAELKAIYSDKQQLEQRIHQLESTMHLLILRKQLKEDSDARLSGICSDTPEKKHGHLRLGNAVDRLERQAASLQREIAGLQESKQQLDAKLQDFLQQAPHMRSHAEAEDSQIIYINTANKAEHLQKVCDLQNGELRMRDQLIEQFSQVLQPCFLQLRGHGLATKDLTAKYRGLVRHLQGIRSVTWDDETTSDSGLSSCTNLAEQEEPRPSKGNLSEGSTLDLTFVLPQDTPKANSVKQLVDTVCTPPSNQMPDYNQPKVQEVCAEQLMLKLYDSMPKEEQAPVLSQNKQQIASAKLPIIKVLKPSPSKKPSKINSASSRIHKENKVPFRARPVPSSNYIPSISTLAMSKSNKPRTPSSARSAVTVGQKPLG